MSRAIIKSKFYNKLAKTSDTKGYHSFPDDVTLLLDILASINELLLNDISTISKSVQQRVIYTLLL